MFIIFLIHFSETKAQHKIGISIAPGVGNIYTSQLNDVAQSLISPENKIISAAATRNYGFNIGLGAYYQYSFNERLSLLSDVTFNMLNSAILMNYKVEDFNKSGTGTQIRYNSVADITSFYGQIPITVKYIFFPKRKFYVLGGGAINIMAMNKLKSSEESTKSEYGFERITSTEISPKSINTIEIDKYNPINFSAVVAIGRQFRKKLNHFSIDLRYNFPITNSEFYSTKNVVENAQLNSLFTETGLKELKESKPSFKLDNFSMGTISLTVRYTLKKWDKTTKLSSINKNSDSTLMAVPTEITKDLTDTISAKSKKKAKKAKKEKATSEAVNTGADPSPSATEVKPEDTKESKKKAKKAKKEKATAEAVNTGAEPSPSATEVKPEDTKEGKKKAKKAKKEKATSEAVNTGADPSPSAIEVKPEDTKESKKKAKKAKKEKATSEAVNTGADPSPSAIEVKPEDTKESKKKAKKAKKEQLPTTETPSN